ncbi:hypothetical protein [Leptolyngbya sp. PCC 6406]|uniref:hypothetical protein n=1 Tax=Leptolyngbya sp. PCC 6406 TaxID=1173264 RepID=UPI0002AC9029|nr:hypothetical protein [Leptolyngbya sp. PCC 6406]
MTFLDSPLLFSKFKSHEFNELCDLLCTVFEMSRTEITEVYDNIRSTFDEPGWPPHHIRRSIFKSGDESFQETYAKSPVIAVDLPSSFELDNGSQEKQTIVIIAQDSKSDRNSQEIPIGTPFGLHHKGSREVLGTTKFYYEMIAVLMQMDYRVYLTDIFKVWVCDPGRPYNRIKLPLTDQNRFFKALEAELPIINPSVVITWGRDASFAMHKVKYDIKHLAFPHPGGAAGGAWAKLLGDSPTRVNKLAYWKSAISQALHH